MAKNKKDINEGLDRELLQNVEMIKMLLIMIVDNMGIKRKDISKMLGISEGRLSQILNPKKYK